MAIKRRAIPGLCGVVDLEGKAWPIACINRVFYWSYYMSPNLPFSDHADKKPEQPKPLPPVKKPPATPKPPRPRPLDNCPACGRG
jgi:hypothetical protein